MLKWFENLFQQLLPPSPGAAARSDAQALQLACAVMLVEVMRADAEIHPAERRRVLAALGERFQLADDEALQLAELAADTARHATDLFAFTERIDQHLDMPAKLRMVELMWAVAYADGELGAGERHIIWRIADLLHVPAGALQHARLRAKGG